MSAATYHFGSKRELIEALLERHSRPIQNDWAATRMAGLLYCSIRDYLRLTANSVEMARDLFVADLVLTIVAAVRGRGATERH